MTAEAWTTLGVLGVTVFLLVTERFPPALTMLGANVALLLFGVLDEKNAFAGFSNAAPITIAALYVLAAAAEETGALTGLADRALGSGIGARGRSAEIGRIAIPTTFASAFVANTPLVAILAPRVQQWARRHGRSPSLYLMPLSHAAVLGGVITIMGTSTNLVVNGLLERAPGVEPLRLFDITPVGLPVAVAGVLVLVTVAPRLLPDRPSVMDELTVAAREYSLEMVVDPRGPLVGRTVSEAGLRHLQGVFLVAIDRKGKTIAPVAPEERLEGEDRLTFVGAVDRVLDLQQMRGLRSAEERHFEVLAESQDRRLFEVVVAERSPLVGSTLKEVGFRNRYDAAVLAIHRADQRVPGKVGEVRLRAGDVLLVLADPGFSQRWRNSHDFLVVSALEGAPPARRERAPLVYLAFAFLVASSATGLLSLLEAALVAAVVLVLAGVVSPDRARAGVDFNVIVIMATSISLGSAVESSGLASTIAEGVVKVGAPFGDLGIVTAVLLTTMLLTEVLSNNAAAALMTPVALGVASQAGLEPLPLAVVVLVGASCSFLTPIGYQTNTMVWGMGGYRFTDFTRVGVPLTLSVVVVTVLVTPLAFPLHG
ncbi:MAG: SLC13 family permease [Acidimicrobiales bacterium]|nr:MAG: SLC13 family permease [Acidimicrobiales bacterium]